MTKGRDALARHAVRIDGNGDTVLLLGHGYGCDQSVWNRVRPALSHVGRKVTYDITGAGASDFSHFDERGRHSDLTGHATDLIEICEELDSSPVTFVGHSVSAMIGLIAASRRPELFEDLILVAPSPYYLNEAEYRGGFDRDQLEGLLEIMAENFTNWAGIVAPIIMGHSDRTDLHNELSGSFCRWDEAIAKHFARLTFLSDTREVLPTVTNDCLILQCEDDVIAPDFVGAYVSEKIASSALHRLKASGHCPHVSHPEEFVQVVLDRLQVRKELRPHAA